MIVSLFFSTQFKASRAIVSISKQSDEYFTMEMTSIGMEHILKTAKSRDPDGGGAVVLRYLVLAALTHLKSLLFAVLKFQCC